LLPGELYGRLGEALVASRLDGPIAVTGTVVGFRRRRWWSFELIEQRPGSDTAEALVRVVLFAGAARAAEASFARTGTSLVDGATATVTGRLEWDPGWGLLRLVGREVSIVEERSALVERRDELVGALAASGLLGAQRRLVAPTSATRVALVAGAGTAAAADVDAVLQASGISWRVLRRSVPMAGPSAPAAIAAAIGELAAEDPEVIVVARGGGGRAELGCWDSAEVAQAIAGCRVPVWTAIGHASDSTVADLVANRAFATPTAAAGALVEGVQAAARARAATVAERAHAAEVATQRARARNARVVAALAVGLALLVLLVLWA
jgi:exodeoxyribonuclease VII large subunit